MFEKSHESLISSHRFLARLIKSIMIGLLIIILAQFIGMIGYHKFESMPWIDAFANAAMILSGMGPLTPLNTNEGKLFAGFYALFSGLAFIIIIGVIFAPIMHRFLHRFHVDS